MNTEVMIEKIQAGELEAQASNIRFFDELL